MLNYIENKFYQILLIFYVNFGRKKIFFSKIDIPFFNKFGHNQIMLLMREENSILKLKAIVNMNKKPQQ